MGVEPTSRNSRKKPASRKPAFGDFLRKQENRRDIVGDLARVAQSSQFQGSSISDMWEHLDRLNIVDESVPAMTQAEQDFNLLVLDWETKLRARFHVKSVVSGGLPGLGQRR